jgi:hypothetical protein
MIEDKLKPLIDEIFKDRKRLCAGEFWGAVERSIDKVGKREIDYEVYQGIAELYQQKYLGLESGDYIKF